MASYTITQKALALLAAEEQQKRIQEQQRAALLAAETSAKAEAERNERIRLETERELTRAAVERSLIEKAAAEAQAAEAVALQAELTRLRNRNETEILRDEMTQMRAEITALKARPIPLLTPPPQDLHLRIDGELDMRFKSSKEELATARAEIAELKAVVNSLLSGGFRIRNKESPKTIVSINEIRIPNGGMGSHSSHPTLQASEYHTNQANSTWIL